MTIGTNVLIITLKVNGLNAPTKDTAWPKGLNKTKQNKTKQKHIYMLWQETQFRLQDT